MSIGQVKIPEIKSDTLTRRQSDQTNAKVNGDKDFANALTAMSATHKLNHQALGQATATVAEVIRLDMLRSAFSLGSSPSEAPLPTERSNFNLLLKALADASTSSDPIHNPQHVEINSSPPDLQHSAPIHLNQLVDRASARFGVDAGLIKAVIKAESNFNPQAVSHAGAQGLMQLMPATAKGLGVTDPFDPEQNVMAGTRFLRDLLIKYDGNVDSALAAYNWGPGNVDKRTGFLPRETREYLVKVKTYYSDFVA